MIRLILQKQSETKFYNIYRNANNSCFYELNQTVSARMMEVVGIRVVLAQSLYGFAHTKGRLIQSWLAFFRINAPITTAEDDKF